jgi:hypothetical protein
MGDIRRPAFLVNMQPPLRGCNVRRLAKRTCTRIEVVIGRVEEGGRIICQGRQDLPTSVLKQLWWMMVELSAMSTHPL